MSQDEPPDNVVHVTFGVKGWAHKPDTGRSGYHNCFANTLLDAQARTVECAKCGKIQDAFEVMNYWANDARHTLDWIGALRAEQSALGKSVEALKAEEQRVKARVKNAVKKDAEAAVLAEKARSAVMHNDIYLKAREIAHAAEKIRCLIDPEYARERRRAQKAEDLAWRVECAAHTKIYGGDK